jgi:hypothetical protein
MKRSTVLLVPLLALAPTLADEGMWPPHQLPQISERLAAAGLETDPSRLRDLTEHPMNAVISLGGCTASFVSPDGLVVTNHHCAYGAIQYNSSEERNLLKDGFVAWKRPEELFAGPGSRVLVTVAFDDVTESVLEDVSDGMTPRERYQSIEDRVKELVRECEQDAGHRCRVSSFHGGVQYFLIKQLEIKDVRLVYAPAGSVGKFGGDVDNWMWPRHTGDFSLYRAYVAKDGNPAEYDAENVPFRPKHWLRIAREGLSEGDFVMVAGYPGRTNRYRTTREATSMIEWRYPTFKQEIEAWIGLIETETADRPEAAIKYAGLLAGLNNVAKNYQGMLDGFAKSDIIERKEALESDLVAWIEADSGRKARYGAALAELRELIAETDAMRERSIYYEYLANRSALLGVAETLYRLSREKEKPDSQREPGYQERDLEPIRERMTRLERTFDPAVDRAVWEHMILRYDSTPPDQHVEAFDAWFGFEPGAADAESLRPRIAEMYEKTKLGELETRLALLDASRDKLERSDDPFIQMAVHLYDSSMELEEEGKQRAGRFQQLRPRYMEALIDYLESRGGAVYPDANGTLRVTFGHVKGYSPRDAVEYEPFTTLRGVLQKETGEDPFDSPPSLIAAIKNGDHGAWTAEGLETVPVNFLSSVDTTGGNSGSPTLNARGELVGLLFDGNYESINSDWDYNREITRSIHVDVRYMLWVMDVVDDAQHLLEELAVASPAATRLKAGAGAAGD